MTRGPKPLPTKTLEQRGAFKRNPNRRRLNEPASPESRPRMPTYLGVHGKRAWKKVCRVLDEMGLLSTADTTALEIYAQTYQDYRLAVENVRKIGQLIIIAKDGKTNVKRNPADVIQERKGLMLIKLLTEFGLTPSSRARVQALPEEKDDPFEKFLRARENPN